jgi:hypothetical protein
VRGEDEVQAGDAVDDRREHVLQRVGALEVLRQGDAEDAEQQDPLGRAEVAAIDAGRVDTDRCPQPALLVPADVALGQHPVDPRLQDDEHERDRDEDGHDCLEGRGREDEQQDRAGRPAQQRGGAQPQHPPPLALELAAIADRARDRPGHQPDRVRHVRGYRRVAECEQHREGDEGPAADHRVDRPGREPGEADGDDLADVHVMRAAGLEPATLAL